MSVPDSAVWLADAACRARPDLPWDSDADGTPGNHHQSRAVRDALAVCRRCAARKACLADADATEAGPSWVRGIRGGLTKNQRIDRRLAR